MIVDRSMRWIRVGAAFWSLLFVLIGIQSIATLRVSRNPVDFLSFWAAARLTVEGRAAAAYDVAAHRIVEMSAAPFFGQLPFPYPPPFLLVVAPLGLLEFAPAFGLWIATTFGLYLLAAYLFGGRVSSFFAAAQPAVAANFLNGQNGLLTSSILIAGTAMLTRRPWVGGAIFGLMVIKPQLALLIPIALVAARLWSALAAAALSAFAALILSALVLGWSTYPAFASMIPLYNGFLAEARWPWGELASPFAMMRHLGFETLTASIVHGIIALAAAGLVWHSWRTDHPHRQAILASATILAPPYLLTYDSTLLALPLMALLAERKPVVVIVIWCLCLLPVLTYFGWYSGPNTVPLAAIISLLALVRNQPAAKKMSPTNAGQA